MPWIGRASRLVCAPFSQLSGLGKKREYSAPQGLYHHAKFMETGGETDEELDRVFTSQSAKREKKKNKLFVITPPGALSAPSGGDRPSSPRGPS